MNTNIDKSVLLGVAHQLDQILEEEFYPPLGKWGKAKEKYMEQHELDVYYEMEYEGTLWPYLTEIDEQAREMNDHLLAQGVKSFGMTPVEIQKMKNEDFLGWVGKMNNLQNQVDEVIRETLIYEN